jgi:hypothetical protein
MDRSIKSEIYTYIDKRIEAQTDGRTDGQLHNTAGQEAASSKLTAGWY